MDTHIFDDPISLCGRWDCLGGHLCVTIALCFKVQPKARPPPSTPPLRLLAERYGVPPPPVPVVGTAPKWGGGAVRAGTSSSSSSWRRERELSTEEEIVYAPPHGRSDESLVYGEEEADVKEEGDDRYEEIEVEEEGDDDEFCDDEEAQEGPVGFEVVTEHAPWAGVSHKGKGKASRGARILEDDDGGLGIVVLDIYVCLYHTIDDQITCVILTTRRINVTMKGYLPDAYGAYQTREGYFYKGKLYMSDTYTLWLMRFNVYT